jgi:hypothetical protein
MVQKPRKKKPVAARGGAGRGKVKKIKLNLEIELDEATEKPRKVSVREMIP